MQVLQFIKTHAVSLLCGLVAILAIGGAVLGMSSGEIVEKMKAEINQTGAGNIRSLKSNPKNEQIIEWEKRRGELFEQEYVKTVDEAKRINTRPVMMKGVFPQAKRTATPYEYKLLYKRTMEVLYTKLDADTLPTDAEIQEEAQNVEDLRLLEAEQKAEEEGGDASGQTSRLTSGPRPSSFRGRTARGGDSLAPPAGRSRFAGGSDLLAPPGRSGGRSAFSSRGGMGPGAGTQISVTRSAEPKYDPVYRARVAKARSILCYYDEMSFHVSPTAYQDGAPTPEDMWFAQVGLWVQEDVVQAIAGLNREAANRVTEGEACVENVPVKRLVLLRVLGYDTPKGRIAFLDAANTQLPLSTVSLTGRKCNEQYDVVRFIVSVVVDQRDILQLIDRISRVNFYQCLKAGYEPIDHDGAVGQGYFYGTDPVVTATLEFEGYMARDVYAELMPPAIRELLGIEGEGD